MPVINRVADMTYEVAAWRHDLHENPELLFDVHRTAGIVAQKLQEFGVDEIVHSVAFLMAPAARNITAQTLVLDGGWTAQ